MIRVALAVLLAASAFAQQGRPDKAAQIEAMKKLSFLTGKWEGEATVRMGPGEPRKLKQSEDVQYRLDGTILVVEGTGSDAATGDKVFNAFGVISYDEAAKGYKIRAYTEGRIADSPLEVTDKGFKWFIVSGPYRINYAMNLNDKGEWVETGDAVVGERTFRTVEMTVRKK